MITAPAKTRIRVLVDDVCVDRKLCGTFLGHQPEDHSSHDASQNLYQFAAPPPLNPSNQYFPAMLVLRVVRTRPQVYEPGGSGSSSLRTYGRYS